MNLIIIDDSEIQDLPNLLNSNVELRMLYKRKGVPMNGMFWPELDKDYEFVIRKDNLLQNTAISWKKK